MFKIHSPVIPVNQAVPQGKQVTIQPHENWLSKSLPNLEDLLSTIPSSMLVSKDDEKKLQEDFINIMHEIKTIKVDDYQDREPTLPCDRCNFNTKSMESLQIHTSNVHEQVVYRCNKCTLCVLSEHVLLNHKRLNHPIKEPIIIIKKSLNLIKGEAGSLSDLKSNPNRGQAINVCQQILNHVVNSVILGKKDSTKVDTNLGLNVQGNKSKSVSERDKKSNIPELIFHVLKKDSTKVDIKPGSNCQVFPKRFY